MGGGYFGGIYFGQYAPVYGAEVPMAAAIVGSSTVTANLTREPGMVAAIIAGATVTANLSVTDSLAAAITGQGTVTASLTVTSAEVLIAAAITAGATVSATLALTASLAAQIAGSSTTVAGLVATYGLQAFIVGQGAVTARLARTRPPQPGGIRVDLYDAAGVKLSAGPFAWAMEATYGQYLDEIGTWEIVMPADAERADLFHRGYEARIYREGEGLVFRGIVQRAETRVQSDGSLVKSVMGDSILIRLAWRELGLGYSRENVSLATFGADLVSGTGVTLGTVDAPAFNSTLRADGATRWSGGVKVAELFRVHMREDVLANEIDLSALGTDSGYVFRSMGDAFSVNTFDNTKVFPIQELTIEEDGSDVWNKVTLLGAGEGINQLHLGYSDRTSPYTIQSAVGFDGVTRYYVSDSASVTAYGLRETTRTIKEAIPLGNSAASFTNAANALYDAGVTWMQRRKDEQFTVSGGKVEGLRHINTANGAYLWQMGQKARVQFKGIAHRPSGAATWVNIDESMYIMGYKRTFRSDGPDTWDLRWSRVDRQLEQEADILAKAIQEIQAIKVAVRPFTANAYHGPFRDSADASNPMPFVVDYDANVFLVHKARLKFRVRGLRANATTAANGGATVTSTAGGGATVASSSSGGGQTSSGGSSHTHSVTGQSASAGGSHRHQVFNTGTAVLQTGGGPTPSSTQDISASHTHGENGSVTDAQSNGHTHSLNDHGHPVIHQSHDYRNSSGSVVTIEPVMWSTPAVNIYTYETVTDHTHTVTGTTSGGEASHTHTVSNHTHTTTLGDHTHSITLGDHIHALTYGIFQQSTPGAPAVNVTINGVNRTVALGGPWNTGQTLDITQYLVSANGQPLRQDNAISFSVAQLCDLEVSCVSLASASNILPV